MKSAAKIGTLIAALAAAATCFAAATITTATGKGADTYVTNDQKGGPTKSFGAAHFVEVRQLAGATSRTRIAYLRFDLSSVSGDKSAATLTLNMYKPANRARSISVYGLKDGDDDNWPESELSYSTAPGLKKADLGTFAIDTDKLTKLGTIAFSEQDKNKTSTAIDLPLDTFLKSDTNGLITLVLIDDATDADGQEDYYIDTKDGIPASAPRLTFPNATGGDTTLPTTEPSSQPARKSKAATTKSDPGLP